MVLPRIYLLKRMVRGANIYVIEEDKGIVIVDCGSEGSDEGIIDFIESLGSTSDDIRMIILTHAHPDHVGSLPELIDLTDAEVLIHKDEIALLERFTLLSRDKIPNLRLLGGGEMLDVLGGLSVIHAPGHTDGSIVLYKPKELIFTGDVVVVDKDGRIALPKPEYTKNQKEEINSAKKILTLDFEALLPGHGPPLTENVKVRAISLLKSISGNSL